MGTGWSPWFPGGSHGVPRSPHAPPGLCSCPRPLPVPPPSSKPRSRLEEAEASPACTHQGGNENWAKTQTPTAAQNENQTPRWPKAAGKSPFVCCSGVGRTKPRCLQSLWDARRGAELLHVHVHQVLAHPAPNQSTGCGPSHQSCAISTGGAGGGSTAPAGADVWDGSRRQPQNVLSIPPMCRALGSPSSCTGPDRGTGSRSFSSPYFHFQAFFVPSMPPCSCQEGVPVSPNCPAVPIPPPARPAGGHHHGEVPHPPAGLLFCCFIHLENCSWS